MAVGTVGAQSSVTSNSQNELTSGLMLLGGGAQWAAGNGTSALYIDWEDNYAAHHLTDGANWGPWPTEQGMENTRGNVTQTLEQSGFNVSFAGDIPSDLSQFSLVVVEAYWACNSQNAQIIQNFVYNGGGVIILAGVPCYFVSDSKNWNGFDANSLMYNGGNLSPIETWFGAEEYLNTGGIAKVAFDNPFSTPLLAANPFFNVTDGSAAAVSSLSSNARAIALWDSGSIFAFTNEYGKGRVYYQSDTDVWSSLPPPAPPQQASLTATCLWYVTTGFMVSINGNLSYNNTGIAQAPITLSYSVTGGETWQDLTYVLTGSDGSFSADWTPLVTGTFFIKATWAGNATFSPATTTVSLVIAPVATATLQNAQNVISIVSNSTVSSFAFNSTSQELSFTVTGPSGTTGYVDAYIAKNLTQDISNLKVYLDGNILNYTASSTENGWMVQFTYHHSTHSIVISLAHTKSSSSSAIPLAVEVIAGIIIASFIAALAVAIGFVSRKKNSSQSDSGKRT